MRDVPDSSLGTIRMTEIRNPQYPHILERVDCTLDGGPYYYISVPLIRTGEMDAKKNIITLPGLRLRIVDSDPWCYLVRTDGIWSVMIYWLRRGVKLFDLVYRRLILTATVWNLATYQDGKIPNWRGLKWFRGDKTLPSLDKVSIDVGQFAKLATISRAATRYTKCVDARDNSEADTALFLLRQLLTKYQEEFKDV